MFKGFFKIAVAAFSVFLVSCSNEGDLDIVPPSGNAQTRAIQTSDFTVENGYLSFVNMEAYNKVVEMLDGKNQNELLTWSNGQGYNSLLKTYCKAESLLVETEGDETNELPKFKMANEKFASLFNENGIMLINDSIYKAIDDYVYIIGNRDFDTLEKLEKSSGNYESLPVISRYRHTEPLKVEKSTRGVSDGDRSFVIDVSSKRREYANFNVSLSTSSSGQLYLDISLEGRGQKKKLWWGTAFSDEFEWAQFTCLGGSINDKIPFTGKTSARITGAKSVSESIPLGVSSHSTFLRTTVEFSFTKNAKKPNEFYSNQYYRTN